MRDCKEKGIWFPVIVLVHKTAPEAQVPSELNLPLCEKHKDSSKLEDFFTPDFWALIVRSFAQLGKATPTRELTHLSWTKTLSFDLPGPKKPS
jgi:hypothetical protein